MSISSGKNSNFIQVSRKQGTAAIAALAKKSVLALQIYMFLAEKIDEFNAVVCPSKVLEEKFKRSRSRISAATSILKKGNYLGVSKAGTTNVYHLNSDAIWTSKNGMRKHAECKGIILMALSEQGDYVAPKKKVVRKKTAVISIEHKGIKTY